MKNSASQSTPAPEIWTKEQLDDPETWKGIGEDAPSIPTLSYVHVDDNHPMDAPSGKQDSYDLSKDCDYGHYVTPSHDPLAATPFYHSPAANVTDSTPKQEPAKQETEPFEEILACLRKHGIAASLALQIDLHHATASLRADLDRANKEVLLHKQNDADRAAEWIKGYEEERRRAESAENELRTLREGRK